MHPAWSTFLWPQLAAAIDMLENAIRACPDALWSRRSEGPEFWYLSYHTLFWLDLYLSPSADGFIPPAPFGLSELDPAGRRHERAYTRDELLAYLRHGRAKCRSVLESLSDVRASQASGFEWMPGSVAELLIYNLRHVQHGVAQLNLILRHAGEPVPPWIARQVH
jgi:hypothetical protein